MVLAAAGRKKPWRRVPTSDGLHSTWPATQSAFHFPVLNYGIFLVFVLPSSRLDRNLKPVFLKVGQVCKYNAHQTSDSISNPNASTDMGVSFMHALLVRNNPRFFLVVQFSNEFQVWPSKSKLYHLYFCLLFVSCSCFFDFCFPLYSLSICDLTNVSFDYLLISSLIWLDAYYLLVQPRNRKWVSGSYPQLVQQDKWG